MDKTRKNTAKSAIVFFIIALSLGYMGGGIYRKYKTKKHIQKLIQENKRYQEESMRKLSQKINDQISRGN